MPESFDAERKRLGQVNAQDYVPLSVRSASGNTGLLSRIPGSYTATKAAVAAGATPPKASDAPVAGKENLFTGLVEALNQHQQDLIQQKKREIADIYDIKFDPAIMGESTVKRPGNQNITQAPMQNNQTAEKLNAAKNSVNRNAMTWPVKAGTQIVQLIDQIVRNSSYITDQQIVQISPIADPVTGVQKQTPSPGTGTGTTAWYKISVATEQLGMDNIIRDHAYRITYIITPYAVAQLASQYFPDSKYRGVHKSYQYWFTGNNTQILNYEQKYNNAYRLVLSGQGENIQKQASTDFRDVFRKTYMATSENHAQGAKNYTNEPGDNAASFLYDPISLSKANLRIVGDPSWMAQGESGLGVRAGKFSFIPFSSDGSMNFDSQAVLFDVSFNQPVDYDFNTGIIDPNVHNSKSGLPQEHYTFTAIQCKNIFSKGRFEQEIEGRLLIEYKKSDSTSQGRVATTASATAAGSRTGSTVPDDGSRGYEIRDETGQVSNIRKNEYGDLYYPLTPQPATPPGAPTSSGDVTPADVPAPQNASAPDKILANEEETAAVNAYIEAGGTFPRGTGPITSGPLFDNVVAAKAALTARQQAASVPATTSTPPQIMDKET